MKADFLGIVKQVHIISFTRTAAGRLPRKEHRQSGLMVCIGHVCACAVVPTLDG